MILLMKFFIVGVLIRGPFKEKLDQWLITVNELFFTAILIGMVFIDSGGMSAETRHKVIGMAIIVLYLGLMVFNTIIATISCYYEYKDIFSKKKEEENDVKSGGLSKVIEKREKLAKERLESKKLKKKKVSKLKIAPNSNSSLG